MSSDEQGSSSSVHKVRGGDKMRAARETAKACMSATMLDAYDMTCAVLDQRDAEWQHSIVRIAAPNPEVSVFATSAAFEAAVTQADAAAAAAYASGGGAGGAARHRTAEHIARVKWTMLVYAVVRTPAGKEAFVMGYSVAAAGADAITSAANFRRLTMKQRPKFHEHGFLAKHHLRNAELPGSAIRDEVFGAILEFDVIHMLSNWVANSGKANANAPAPASTLTATATADAGAPAVTAPAPAADPAAVVPAAVPATKPKTRAPRKPAASKLAKKTQSRAAHPILVEKERRQRLAKEELAALLATGASVRALAPDSGVAVTTTTALLTVADKNGLAHFPRSFSVDLESLAAKPDDQAMWKTAPICQALLVALNPDRYALQPFAAWLARTHGALRSTNVSAMLDAYRNDPLQHSSYAMAEHLTEMLVACQTISELATALPGDRPSPLFVHARAFIAAAELAERVARVRDLPTGPDPSEPAWTCALTGEPIAPGTPCDAYDLVLHEALLPLFEEHAPTLPAAVTLVVKKKSGGTWTLLSHAAPAPAPPVVVVTPAVADAAKKAPRKRKRADAPAPDENPSAAPVAAAAPAKKRARKTSVAPAAPAAAVVVETPAPAPAPLVNPSPLPSVFHSDPHLDDMGLVLRVTPVLCSLLEKSHRVSIAPALEQKVSEALYCTSSDFAKFRQEECAALELEERVILAELVDAFFVPRAGNINLAPSAPAVVGDDDDDDDDALLAPPPASVSTQLGVLTRPLPGLVHCRTMAAKFGLPHIISKRPHSEMGHALRGSVATAEAFAAKVPLVLSILGIIFLHVILPPRVNQ